MSVDPWKDVNREDFPLVYVGADTRWGLRHGTPFHLITDAKGRASKGRSGLRGYTDPKGDAWQVPPQQVGRYVKPPTRVERLKAKVGRR